MSKKDTKNKIKKGLKKRMCIALIIFVIFSIASTLSVYSYGKFSSRVKGETSYAIAPQTSQTALDRIISPYTQVHPNQTGLILLNDNLDAFVARAIAAREAERSLDLQYYIWHDDLTGQLLDLEVLHAADRGVRVRMLLDDMTAHGKQSALVALNSHPNIEIRLFNPTRARENSLRRGVEMLLRLFNMNRRMHNKAWIADNRLAVVGGRNIGDEYFDANKGTNFFDMDMFLIGTAVEETSAIFDSFWNSEAVVPLSALKKPSPQAIENFRQKVSAASQELAALPYIQRLKDNVTVKSVYSKERQVHWSADVHVYSDPAEKGLGLGKSQWLIHTLFPMWISAEKEFKVISPYFVPGEVGVQEFEKLIAKGANVSILTNSLAATDVVASHSGYAPYRAPLLKAGAKLFELKPFSEQKQSFFGSSGASLHTKAFVVDEKTAFVGSFNFDPRSANLNTEMGIVFTEPTIVAEVLNEFHARTRGKYSYQAELLTFPHEGIVWRDYYNDTAENPDRKTVKTYEQEPETSWYKRTAATMLSWLPIEGFL